MVKWDEILCIDDMRMWNKWWFDLVFWCCQVLMEMIDWMLHVKGISRCFWSIIFLSLIKGFSSLPAAYGARASTDSSGMISPLFRFCFPTYTSLYQVKLFKFIHKQLAVYIPVMNFQVCDYLILKVRCKIEKVKAMEMMYVLLIDQQRSTVYQTPYFYSDGKEIAWCMSYTC